MKECSLGGKLKILPWISFFKSNHFDRAWKSIEADDMLMQDG